MADSVTRKRALEILADPRSKENEWLGALAILDGKIPPRSRKYLLKKIERFFKRSTGLAVLYTGIFSLYGLIVFGQPFYWSIIPAALIWATLEASFGAFTLLALIVMLTHLGSIVTLNPYYQTTWMVILLNIFVYAKWNWRPYVFVPVRKIIAQQRKPKLLN